MYICPFPVIVASVPFSGAVGIAVCGSHVCRIQCFLESEVWTRPHHGWSSLYVTSTLEDLIHTYIPATEDLIALHAQDALYGQPNMSNMVALWGCSLVIVRKPLDFPGQLLKGDGCFPTLAHPA